MDDLSASQARRVVLSAQGFGRRPHRATLRHVRTLASRLLSFRIDSVNVLERSHRLPAFSRLGAYPVDAVDRLAYESRELFEVGAHGVCLVPVSLYPLFRHRMEAVEAFGPRTDRPDMRPDKKTLERVLEEVSARGPMTVRELSHEGRRFKGRWWSGSVGKVAMEHLLATGRLAVAERRGLERVYDVAERVIPREVLDAPDPGPEQAQKELLCLAARAQGIATVRELGDYFALPFQVAREKPQGGGRPRPTRDRLVAELVDDGRLVRVAVEGWTEPGYMDPAARLPRAVDAAALVGPFDSVLWGPLQRLCGFEQFLAQQLYVPASKRMFGYFVLPFVLGEGFVARCDMRTDRARGVLVVESAHLEPGEDEAEVAAELAGELLEMRAWLGLEAIEVGERGDLSGMVREALDKIDGRAGVRSRAQESR